MTPYILTYIISTLISLFKNKRNTKLITIILITILTLFAGTRNEGIDNDYKEYTRLFNLSVNGGLPKDYEAIFVILPKLLSYIFYNDYVLITFLVFALLGVSTKIIAIEKLSINFTLSIIIYFSTFFLGQEFTTIRAGVASGIFLLMTNDIVNNNRKKYFLKVFIALFFHYSSLLFIPIWFLVRSKLNLKYYYFALILSFISVYLKFNVLSLLNLSAIIPKVQVYTEGTDEVSLNLFNFKMLISLLYLIIFTIFYVKGKKDQWFLTLLKLHIVSLIIFYLLAQSSIAFSLRCFNLLSIVQILLLPYFVKFIPNKIKLLGYFLIIITSFLSFYYILFVANIIKSYSSWLF